MALDDAQRIFEEQQGIAARFSRPRAWPAISDRRAYAARLMGSTGTFAAAAARTGTRRRHALYWIIAMPVPTANAPNAKSTSSR
jgi:hypothetical protein